MGLMEEQSFDVSDIAKSDMIAIKRALSRFTPAVDATLENIRRYFLARVALKKPGQRVMKGDVVSITAKTETRATMKSEIIVVPNGGRDLSALPIAALKVAEEIQNLPTWFDSKRFLLVDSNVSAKIKEALGYGLFVFEAALSSAMTKFDGAAELSPQLHPPPVPAAVSGPSSSETHARRFLFAWPSRFAWPRFMCRPPLFTLSRAESVSITIVTFGSD